ncbi:hypothetical protein LIER_29762 [Lithospermum erythrorhizon]|uniref:Uncharacterized protein n=1 Tax=Lithospermum erythrorhizon TaxID=34254 RepID=A0AAV3RNS9_LITER
MLPRPSPLRRPNSRPREIPCEPRRRLCKFAMMSSSESRQMELTMPLRLWPKSKERRRDDSTSSLVSGLTLPLPEGAVLLEEGGETPDLPIEEDHPANP